MRILLTGCKGQLGLELIKQIGRKKSCTIMDTDVHNLDITNQADVFNLIGRWKPDAVINCAAFTNVDDCERNELTAFKVNAIGARNLSVAAYKHGSSMVHISTDYVFDGTGSTPKREYDPINPQSCYGRSKALGEELVRETNPRHYIMRTAWLYGEGNNFVKTMLKLAKERNEIDVVCDQTGSPTSTVDLANCIINLLETESYGTYHATCEGSCSWYDFAKEIFNLKGISTKVNKITTEQLSRPAARPKYSVLDNFMLKLIGLNSFRHWEVSLEDYLKGEDPK